MKHPGFHAYLVRPTICRPISSTVSVDRQSKSWQPLSETVTFGASDTAAATLTPELGCLDVHQVAVSMREHDLLTNVSFTARRGSLTAIIGPLGAGKSTLAKLTAGLGGSRHRPKDRVGRQRVDDVVGIGGWSGLQPCGVGQQAQRAGQRGAAVRPDQLEAVHRDRQRGAGEAVRTSGGATPVPGVAGGCRRGAGSGTAAAPLTLDDDVSPWQGGPHSPRRASLASASAATMASWRLTGTPPYTYDRAAPARAASTE
jgi:ABC transporter